ncbi:DUF2946 domain-containing protein [Pseudomonas sp. REP124]|uniref:DUF2946 domain-containing protein n=1 Tax=Pseudomonas sp. REP124 TaxID=2875731 RepID=UPI001CCBFD1E|nr:DUF2946 domain-containing protein [Pseudomonas sp. REP124]MBZ9783766.1 DUF2946 domain-containing protein [Pseudomonas sp. REP124]
MSSLKRISPWIACLAVLLNVMAMPLSRAVQTPDIQLMLWGEFCSGGTSQTLPAGLDKPITSLEQASSKLVAQHGDCSCCHAGLVALPSSYFRHFLPRYTPDTSLDNPERPTLHPRIRWASLSPRASPIS